MGVFVDDGLAIAVEKWSDAAAEAAGHDEIMDAGDTVNENGAAAGTEAALLMNDLKTFVFRHGETLLGKYFQ